KSFFMNVFTYLSVLSGSTALIIDPKGDRKGWANGLPYIDENNIEVWEMGKDKDDAGSLDPFRTSTSMDEAKSIAMDNLSFSTDKNINHSKYRIIIESVEKTSTNKANFVEQGINYLDDLFVRNNKKMQEKTGMQQMTD